MVVNEHNGHSGYQLDLLPTFELLSSVLLRHPSPLQQKFQPFPNEHSIGDRINYLDQQPSQEADAFADYYCIRAFLARWRLHHTREIFHIANAHDNRDAADNVDADAVDGADGAENDVDIRDDKGADDVGGIDTDAGADEDDTDADYDEQNRGM